MPSPRHEIRYGGKRYQMDYVFPAEIAALRAHKTGQFQEVPVLEWIAKRQLKGVYIDAGAHVGNHTLFFLEHCPSTRVISIEAHPIIHALLGGNMERNAKRFDCWTGFQRAAWSESGEKVGMAPIPPNNAGHTHVVNTGGRKGEQPEVMVETLALDDLHPRTDVAVLKIDVEDVEEQVIDGAHKILDLSRPVIIAERHNKEQLRSFEQRLLPWKYKRAAEWAGIHTFAWV